MPDDSGAGDALAEKMAGTQDLASAFTFNAIKSAEYDPAAALAPPKGPSVKPSDPIVGASTVTESNGSDKTGGGSPNIGQNPTVGPLDRVRVDSTGRVITTNQGVPVIVAAAGATDAANAFVTAIAKHRHFVRETDPPRV